MQAIHPAPAPQTVVLLDDLYALLQQLGFQAAAAAPLPVVSQPSSWSFTQGLLLGQVSVLVVIVFFTKFFIFADHPRHQSLAARVSGNTPFLLHYRQRPLSTVADEALDQQTTTSELLEKTYYDVLLHAPELLDWFNVLIAQMILQFRAEAIAGDNLYHSLKDFLATTDLPDFLDTVQLKDVDIGSDFPIFSNCRIRHAQGAGPAGRLEAKIDVDLADTLLLGIDTKLLLNNPKPLAAALPVSITVSIVRFSGCLTVLLIGASDFPQLTPPADSSMSNTALLFLLAPDYRIEFKVLLLIGSRSKLQDVPKILWLVELKLREWVDQRCVEPRYQLIRLPSMWPRKKNVREPSED